MEIRSIIEVHSADASLKKSSNPTVIFFDNLHTLLMSLHDYCLKLSARVPLFACDHRSSVFLASALLKNIFILDPITDQF